MSPMAKLPRYELEHVAISVSDIDRTIEWYGANFGFEEVARSDKPALGTRVALMRLGDRLLEIFAPYEPMPLPAGESTLGSSLQRLGTKHMALAVDDVVRAGERLEANGVAIETEIVEGRTSKYLFCTDPDGILIEVIQRN